MADWTLVPCLVALRDEFNRLAPKRDKASDGSVGDTSHGAKPSDHNPDETGRTPTEDADTKNEVHAIDVDGQLHKPGWSMERCVEIIVTRHRQGQDDRLQNVIYNRRIWSRSWGWTARPYTGANAHTEHAHFSARYTTAQEADTSPWGLLELEDDMPTVEEFWGHKISSPSLGIKDRPASDWLKDAEQVSRELAALGKSLLAAVGALAAKDAVDEQALGAALAPGVAVALAPLLEDVEVSAEQLQAAILGALQELAAGPAV